MQQYQGNKECLLKSAADQNTSLLYISSNPYILNRKTNTKAVLPSQACGNFPRCNVTRRLRWSWSRCVHSAAPLCSPPHPDPTCARPPPAGLPYSATLGSDSPAQRVGSNFWQSLGASFIVFSFFPQGIPIIIEAVYTNTSCLPFQFLNLYF